MRIVPSDVAYPTVASMVKVALLTFYRIYRDPQVISRVEDMEKRRDMTEHLASSPTGVVMMLQFSSVVIFRRGKDS